MGLMQLALIHIDQAHGMNFKLALAPLSVDACARATWTLLVIKSIAMSHYLFVRFVPDQILHLRSMSRQSVRIQLVCAVSIGFWGHVHA